MVRSPVRILVVDAGYAFRWESFSYNIEPVSASISIALSQVIEGASGHAALGAVLLSEAAADTLEVTENVVTAMIETVAIVPRVRFIYFLNELNLLILHSCAASQRISSLCKAQILRVKNLIFHTKFLISVDISYIIIMLLSTITYIF